MNIYIAHSTQFDYKNDLYVPIRQSKANKKHKILLPYETNYSPLNIKDFFNICDLVIAEITLPVLEVGIELGWADTKGIPIKCIYRSETPISEVFNALTSEFIEYINFDKKLINYLFSLN